MYVVYNASVHAAWGWMANVPMDLEWWTLEKTDSLWFVPGTMEGE